MTDQNEPSSEDLLEARRCLLMETNSYMGLVHQRRVMGRDVLFYIQKLMKDWDPNPKIGYNPYRLDLIAAIDIVLASRGVAIP